MRYPPKTLATLVFFCTPLFSPSGIFIIRNVGMFDAVTGSFQFSSFIYFFFLFSLMNCVWEFSVLTSDKNIFKIKKSPMYLYIFPLLHQYTYLISQFINFSFTFKNPFKFGPSVPPNNSQYNCQWPPYSVQRTYFSTCFTQGFLT